jgi:hypothetical protein
MKISKNRFDNVKKQVAEMVDKKEIIINDDYITLRGYRYNYTIDNNKIKVILNSYETFVLNVEIEEENVIILESVCNGRKCKSDKTLNKFSKIVSVFYPLYELGFIK